MTAGPGPEEGPVLALLETLSYARIALMAALGGDLAEAAEFSLEASLAAGGAFPPDSEGSRALDVILGAVSRACRSGVAS